MAWLTRVPPLMVRVGSWKRSRWPTVEASTGELVLQAGDQEVHRLRFELRDLDVEVLLERERHGFFEAQLAELAGAVRLRPSGGGVSLQVDEALLIGAHGLLDDGVLARAPRRRLLCGERGSGERDEMANSNDERVS